MTPWNAEFAPPRPRYRIGFELPSGRLQQLADADSLVSAQVDFIQAIAAIRATGGAGILVLLHVATGEVRDRAVVMPDGLPGP
jgi:hypothetical protein